MTPTCHHLDAYLDGRLQGADAEAFEAHALACPRCDAALAEPVPALRALADVACPPALLAGVLDGHERDDPDAPTLFADGYRQLAAVTCPPEVIAGALRAARRAPDRGARPHPARRRTARPATAWAAGLAAALAVAVGVWQGVAPDSGTDPVTVAVGPAQGPAAEPPVGLPPRAAETPSRPAPAADEPPAPRTPRPDRAARASSPAEPPLAAPPATAASAPPADDVAQAAPAAPAEPEITEADVEDARRDLALAFRLVADAQTRARATLREEAGALSTTIDQALPF